MKVQIGDSVKWGIDSERGKDDIFFGTICKIDIDGYHVEWGNGNYGSGYVDSERYPSLFLVYPKCYDDFLDKIRDRLR